MHDLVPWSTREFTRRIWRVSLTNGDETLALDRPVRWHRWTLRNDQILFSGRDETVRLALLQMDPEEGWTRALHELGEKDVGFGLSVSPDGTWMLYSQSEAEAGSDLVLVETTK